MPHHANLTAEHTPRTDLHTSGYAGLPGYDRVLANSYVMGHLNLVIQLYAIRNYGVLDGTPIYGRVCANFHVVADSNATQLGHLGPGPGRFLSNSKPVGANH